MRAPLRRALPVVGFALVVLVAAAIAPIAGGFTAALCVNYVLVHRRSIRERAAAAVVVQARNNRRPVGTLHPIRRHYPVDFARRRIRL